MAIFLDILNSVLFISAQILFILFGYKNRDAIKYSIIFYLIGIINISSFLFILGFSIYIQISDISVLLELFSIYLRVSFFLSFTVILLTFGLCFVIIGIINRVKFGTYLLISGIIITFSYIFMIFMALTLDISRLPINIYVWGGFYLTVNQLVAFTFILAQGIRLKDKLLGINALILLLTRIISFIELGSIILPFINSVL
ncbi:MAG: hypothetical protein ACFE9Q_11230 [Candidatus Hodarchaeota archaeon]